jgi:radical SAM protein with 4Fe4S-binding SPASM domain
VELGGRARDEIIRLARDKAITGFSFGFLEDILYYDEVSKGGLFRFIEESEPPFFAVDTNAIHLTPARSEKLLAHAPFKELNISLDSLSEKRFRKIRPGARSLEQVLQHARTFAEKRRKLGRDDVIFSLSLILMRGAWRDAFRIIKFAKSIGADEVRMRHITGVRPSYAKLSFAHARRTYNFITRFLARYSRRIGIPAGIPRPFTRRDCVGMHGPCDVPWRSAVVLADGRVLPCCMPQKPLGNLNEQSISDIWNGADFRAFRERVNASKPPRICQACFIPGIMCPDNPLATSEFHTVLDEVLRDD